VADEVALLLGTWLAEEVELRQARGGTENVAAWTDFQRGERLRDEGEAALRSGDRDEAVSAFRAADSLYAEAERADPSWPSPLIQRAAVSDAWAQMASRDDPGEAISWLNAGTQYADRALDMDPRAANAHLVRGRLAYQRWKGGLVSDPRESEQAFRQAVSDLEEAVRLDPALAEAWAILSLLRSEEADNTNAKIAAQRAYEADEFLRSADEVLFRLYATSYDLEQFRDAASYCDQGRERFPRHVLFRECRLWLLAAPSSRAPDPDPDEAWAALDGYLEAVPERLQEYMRLKGQILVAGTLGRAQLPDSAEAVLSRSKATPDLDPEMELMGLEALIRLHMGQSEQALNLLRTYLTANPQHREGWQWTAHWWWRPLQENPEFRALMAG
jgi:tetratricopeptide (TPR) repeat protein